MGSTHPTALSYLSPKAAVRISPIHGRGLFASAAFHSREIVCVKGGHVFTYRTLRDLKPLLGPAEIQIADELSSDLFLLTKRRAV